MFVKIKKAHLSIPFHLFNKEISMSKSISKMS